MVTRLRECLQRISISLLTDRQMVRAGSDAPMIQVHVAAVAVVSDAQQTAVHAPKFFKFLHEATGLDFDRCLIVKQ